MRTYDNRPRVIVKKKGGLFGKIVALFLGFIMGATSVVGAIVGTGYYLATRNVEEIDGMVGEKLPDNVNLNELLTDEYYKNTVLNLLGGVSAAAQEIAAGNGSFATLNKISPSVQDVVDSLAAEMKRLGSQLDEEEIADKLMNTKFSELGDYMGGELINSVVIGDLLLNSGAFTYEVLSQDPLMMLLFYGVAGEDYELDDENKTIVMLDGKEPVTMGMIRENGLSLNLHRVPLDTLMKVDSALMQAIAYGSSSHYKTDEDGNFVEMNQQYYLKDGDKFFTDDGKEISASVQDAANGYVLTFEDESTQYVEDVNGDGKYYVFKAENKEEKVLFSKTTVGDLSENSSELLNAIELATVINLENNPSPLLIALAYGVEGEDFYYDADGEIQMYEGKKPMTIGDLQGGALNETISNMPLDALMKVDVNDGMICSLAYGPTSHYVLQNKTDANGAPVLDANGNAIQEAVMKQVVYTLKDTGSGDVLYDIDGNALTVVPVATANPKIFTLTLEKTVNGETVTQTQYLRMEDSVKFYAFESESCADDEKITYKKTTVGDLENNPSDLLNSIELGSALNLAHDSNRVLLSLAYGRREIDYYIDADNNIQMIGEARPRTIGQLQSNSDEVINGIYLADAVNVTAESHPVMIALAYGQKGVDYNIVDGEIVRTAEAITPRSIMDLSGENSKTLLDSITLEDALAVDYQSDKMMLAMAFGQKNVHYKFVPLTDDSGNPVLNPIDNSPMQEIVMNQAFYTYYGGVWHDEIGEALTLVGSSSTSGGVTTFTYQAGETATGEVRTQTVHVTQDGHTNVYLQVESDGTTPIYYQKSTIGGLSEDTQGLLNNVTLADALGIESYETETDAMKKALAFSKDGKPYTIGQLSKDPSKIINEVHLDSVIVPEVGDEMTLYLLYGKENIHFEFVYVADGATAPEGGTAIVDPNPAAENVGKDAYVVMLQKQMAVHAVNEGGETKLHLHNEYGEPVLSDPTNPNSYVLVQDSDLSEYKYQYVHHDITYYLKESSSLEHIRIKGALTDGDVNTYAPAYHVVKKTEQLDSHGEIVKDEHGDPVYEYVDTYFEHNRIADLTDTEMAIVSHLTGRLELVEIMNEQDVQNNQFLKHLDHVTIDELPKALENLTIVDVFSDDIEYTQDEHGNDVISGMWAYLLDDPNSATDTPADYKVTDMDSLVDNMKANMQSVKLGKLVADEIITFTGTAEEQAQKKQDFLNKTISGQKVSELSISQLVELIMLMPNT